jgi:hypothetical protein
MWDPQHVTNLQAPAAYYGIALLFSYFFAPCVESCEASNDLVVSYWIVDRTNLRSSQSVKVHEMELEQYISLWCKMLFGNEKKQRNAAYYTISLVSFLVSQYRYMAAEKENTVLSSLYVHTRGKRQFQKLSSYEWLRLALSKVPSRVGVTLPSAEDGNRYSYLNVVLYCHMDSTLCRQSMAPKLILMLTLYKLKAMTWFCCTCPPIAH